LLGFCGWLPFAQKLEGLLCDATIDIICTPATQRIGSGFFFEHVSSQRLKQTNQTFDGSAFSTSVLLGHGMDDAWVSVDRGRQASFIIRRLMPNVESYEFSGAEAEGHWIKEPEGFDHILQFLQK
jgi:hypothetical protein